MAINIEGRPDIIYNSIPQQVKTAIGSLTVKDWNDVINVLRTQSNITSANLERLYRVLFGSWENVDERYLEYVDAYNSGLLQTLLDTLRQAQETAVIHIGPDSPHALATTLWIDTSEGE